jgi:hypothetical protein
MPSPSQFAVAFWICAVSAADEVNVAVATIPDTKFKASLHCAVIRFGDETTGFCERVTIHAASVTDRN